MPSTLYCQTTNGEGLLCLEDGRTYSRRGQMGKKLELFIKQLMRKQSCHITSLDESDLTY